MLLLRVITHTLVTLKGESEDETQVVGDNEDEYRFQASSLCYRVHVDAYGYDVYDWSVSIGANRQAGSRFGCTQRQPRAPIHEQEQAC